MKVTEDTTIPVAPELQTVVTGVPPGRWLNFPSWSIDGTKVAFTVRSAGATLPLHHMLPCVTCLPTAGHSVQLCATAQPVHMFESA